MARSRRILGIGVDLVENHRIKRMLKKWGPRFTARVFSDAERAYCDSQASVAPHYAGRFAVKEAVAKAFGTGVGVDVALTDVEVIRDPATGAPSVRLAGRARKLARARKVETVFVSLSHTRHYAVAQVVLEGA